MCLLCNMCDHVLCFLQCPEWMWDVTGIAATFAVLALQRTAGKLSMFRRNVHVDSKRIAYDFLVYGTTKVYDLKRMSRTTVLDALAGSIWHVLALSPTYLR